MNVRGEEKKARCMLTHNDGNKTKKTPTTVAFGLCKRWVSACVVPSGIVHLKGHFFIVHVQALGGATFRGFV